METQEKNSNHTSLYIPVNVPERKDIFPGYPTIEMSIALLVVAVCVIFLIVMVMFDHTFIGFAVAAITIGWTLISIRKNNANENMYDFARVLLRFARSQKIFYYVKYDETRMPLHQEENENLGDPSSKKEKTKSRKA